MSQYKLRRNTNTELWVNINYVEHQQELRVNINYVETTRTNVRTPSQNYE